MSLFPLLSRTLSGEMFNRLLGMLPPPEDDSIEALIARDGAAMAAAGSLGPIRSAEEASLAIIVVAADCHAHDAFRSAGKHASNIKIVMQCRSQAMMMMRTRAKAIERLERLQSKYPEVVVQADTAPAADKVPAEQPSPAPEPSAKPPLTPEAKARRLAAWKAVYVRIARRPAPEGANESTNIVSMPLPDPAIVVPPVAAPFWHHAA